MRKQVVRDAKGKTIEALTNDNDDSIGEEKWETDTLKYL